ncbi:MAG: type II toxin-antitoxin system PemK/MazF family toxin [Geminicoccaceae bacterium]
MRRGDLVTIALQGDHGKPRPALVIQADPFMEAATTAVLLVTSTRIDAPLLRINVEPTVENGLRKSSQIMIDKAMTVRNERIGPSFGQLDAATMLRVNASLGLFLGIVG